MLFSQHRPVSATHSEHTCAAFGGQPKVVFHFWGALTLGLIACSAQGALGAQGTDLAEAKARHQIERSACLRGETQQDKPTCLTEADAALAEVKRGNVLVLRGSQYIDNSMRRCEALPTNDREDCLRRMRGEGTTTGTAVAGGIYRELSRPEDAPPRR